MLLAFQASPSLWRQMHPPFGCRRLKVHYQVKRSLEGMKNHTISTSVTLFSSSGSVTLGYAFFSAQPAWKHDNMEPTAQNYLGQEIVEALGQLDLCDVFLRPSKSINKSVVPTDANLISLMTPYMFAKKFMWKVSSLNHTSPVFTPAL